MHWFPVAWIEPVLDGAKFKARGSPGLIGKVPRSSRLDPTNFNAFTFMRVLYKF
jgi:hypothetical protein